MNKILSNCKYSSINGKFMCAYNRKCKATEDQLDELFDNCPNDMKVICVNCYPEYQKIYIPDNFNRTGDRDEDDIYGSEMRDIAEKKRLMSKR